LNSELAFSLLVFVVSMSISMALIPLMIRWAPALGMLDKPDPRKVHTTPIPRVGGVGIVLGALLPLWIWLPSNDLTISFLMGAIVLLVFGIWDDVKELGHYVKFVGQFIAALLVVYHGNLYVTQLPFIDSAAIDESFGRIFTVIAMVGAINAINHSDGLDGLAGGESLLSLGGIAFLAYQAHDVFVVPVAFAAMGGIFGFLRFNSHPARVFMGDGGSQFLGFTLAFLVVYLTQVSNRALSPAIPALLLGLPIVDILSVFAQRIYGGMNWFRATKNHVHHRLLELGYRHYESVMVIYSIQALLVIIGVLMPYESDALLLGFYLVICTLLFTYLVVAERKGLKVHHTKGDGSRPSLLAALASGDRLAAINYKLIQFLISMFLVAGAVFIPKVPLDLTIAAGVLFIFLAIRLLLGFRVWFLYLRLILFMSVAFTAYLFEYYPPSGWEGVSGFYNIFFGLLATAVMFAVRFSKTEFFQVTPLDYLVMLIVAILAVMAEKGGTDIAMVKLVIQLIILFYGVEVVLRHMRKLFNPFTGSSLAALGIVAIRGLL